MLIGIGNVDREDDGVGYRVVERLHQLHPDWPILLVRQLLPELVDRVAGAAHLIFVDADVALTAGEIQLAQIQPAAATAHGGLGSHRLDPAQFMSLLQTVSGAERGLPTAWCCRIGVERFGFGSTMSSKVDEAVVSAASEVEALVVRLLS